MEIAYEGNIVKVTPWFGHGTLPYWPGPYQTKLAYEGAAVCFSFWNGRYWGDSQPTAELAEGAVWAGNQQKSWRGLLEGEPS